jgi:HAE1 family hydrophobic/amphiphilic exporter-1
VRVKVDPRELAARGIGFDDVENAIREANSNEATGSLMPAQSPARSRRLADSSARRTFMNSLSLPRRLPGPAQADRYCLNSIEDDKNVAGSTEREASFWQSSGSQGPTRSGSSIAFVNSCRPSRRSCPGGVKLDILMMIEVDPRVVA